MPSLSRPARWIRNLASLIAFVIPTVWLHAQSRDFYPQVHGLLLEAETASSNIRFLADRSNPRTSIGGLFAHAGYLEDAERVFASDLSSRPGPPYDLWRAWVIYGRMDRVEKNIEAMKDLESKARFLLSLGDLLWRTGEADQARLKFAQSKELAAKVADLAHRKQLLTSIDQGLQFVDDPPPDLVTATPHPRPIFNAQDSPVPLFPITADGFRDADPHSTKGRADLNADFLKQIYDRVAARDPDGLRHLTESAATPFQKALGLTSLEHLMILSAKPALAEEFANAIPETDASSSLAKAEALSAAGTARLKEHDVAKAIADFNSATKVVQSVRDLPLGKVSVLVSVASAQFKGVLRDDGDSTLRIAIVLAQDLPQRPKPQAEHARQTALDVHYQDEAFKLILTEAIKEQAHTVIKDVIEIWGKTGDDADGAAVEAWLDADRPDQAIAVAHNIENPPAKVRALLQIARALLDHAGAPVF